MLVPFEEINHLENAREVVTEQFKNKPVFDKCLQLILSGLTECQSVIKDLIQKRSIDEASGAQLDVIGRIVGQPRELISLDVYKYFAFLGYPNGATFGDKNDPSIGGVFYSKGSPTGGNYTLDDLTYRLFIKSKIIKNRTASTPEELIKFVQFIFGQDTPVYLVEGEASCRVFFGRNLSQIEVNLLSYISFDLGYPSRLIPKTLGVGMEFATFNARAFFAYQGVPNAKGYGSISDTTGWGVDFGEDWGGTGESSLDGGFYACNLST